MKDREPPYQIIIVANLGLNYARLVMEGFFEFSVQSSKWQVDQAISAFAEHWTMPKNMAQPGILGHFSRPEDVAIAEKLFKKGIPVVNTSQKLSEYHIPSVIPDNAYAGKVAAEYLVERKFQHFGFTGIRDACYSAKRGKGFQDRLKELGHSCSELEYGYHNWTHSSVEHNPDLEKWLKELPHPVAVLCGDDIHARRVVNSALRVGIRIPEEMAILGVDNDDLQCKLCPISISSVTIPAKRVGYEATRLLESMLKGTPPPDKPQIITASNVVTRRSTDCVAVDDPVLSSALRFISNNAHHPIKVRDVVEACGASRRYLERRFSTVLGKTPRREIFEVRLARAKCLLSESSMSIQEVADASGFSDAKLFATGFRQETEKTPSEFRREIKQRN